jgi:pectin lyase
MRPSKVNQTNVLPGKHYWAFLFTGSADTITFTQNHIYQTSGRGPHIGGTSGYTQYLHIVNSEPSKSYDTHHRIHISTYPNTTDYFNGISGHAIDAEVGAVALTEGNYFVRGALIPAIVDMS